MGNLTRSTLPTLNINFATNSAKLCSSMMLENIRFSAVALSASVFVQFKCSELKWRRAQVTISRDSEPSASGLAATRQPPTHLQWCRHAHTHYIFINIQIHIQIHVQCHIYIHAYPTPRIRYSYCSPLPKNRI